MDKTRSDAFLNGRQCSESIGISYNAFSKWRVPYTVDGRQKLYTLKDLLEVCKARWRRELEKEIRAEILAEISGSEDEGLENPALIAIRHEKEKLRLTTAQADAQELKNEIARHEVAPFDFITFVVGRAANVIAGIMDSLPVEMMRQFELSGTEVDKVRAVTASASDSLADLGDEQWMQDALDDFISQAD